MVNGAQEPIHTLATGYTATPRAATRPTRKMTALFKNVMNDDLGHALANLSQRPRQHNNSLCHPSLPERQAEYGAGIQGTFTNHQGNPVLTPHLIHESCSQPFARNAS